MKKKGTHSKATKDKMKKAWEKRRANAKASPKKSVSKKSAMDSYWAKRGKHFGDKKEMAGYIVQHSKMFVQIKGLVEEATKMIK